MTKTPARPYVSGFCNVTLPRTAAYDPHTNCRGCTCPCHAEGLPPVTETPDPTTDDTTPAEHVAAIAAACARLGAVLYAAGDAEPEDTLRLLRDLRRATADLLRIDASLVRDLYLTAEHGKRVIDGFGEVWITRARKGEQWEGRSAVFDYVETKIRANDGEMPDPNVVVDWVLEVVSASSPRVTPLRAAGMDPNDYRTSVPGKPQVTVPLD